MMKAEKIILLITIAVGWGYGLLAHLLFENGVELETAIIALLAAALLWLVPFMLLSLFFDKLRFPVIAFTIGSLGFFFIAQNQYIGIGIAVLLLGFIYWFLRVRYAREGRMGFSLTVGLQGIGMFFTILAAFGALLYYYSPFPPRFGFEPSVPEKFFNVVYQPVSSAFFSGVTGMNAAKGTKQSPADEVKPQIYTIVNGALQEIAKKYQEYIPFAFAAAAFFFLRALFIPFKYLVLGVTFLSVKVFLHIGWLRKEMIEVEKEIIKF